MATKQNELFFVISSRLILTIITAACLTTQSHAIWPFDDYQQIKVHALIDRANRLIEKNKQEQAIDYLQKALKINPNNIQANRMLMEGYMHQKEWDKAEQTAKLLMDIDAEHANDYRYAEIAKEQHLLENIYEYIRNDNPLKAKRLLKKFDLSKAQNIHILLSTAQVSLQLKQYQYMSKILQVLNTKVSQFDKQQQAILWYLNAKYEEHQGHIQQAINHYHKSLSLDPKAIYWGSLGYLYLKQNLPEKAQTNFQKATSLQSTNNSYLLGLAQSYIQQAQYNKAIKLYQQAIQNDPGNPDLYASLGYLETSTTDYKDHQNAIKSFKKALALYPPEKQQSKKQQQNYNQTKMALQNTEKEWYVYFSDSFRLDKSRFSPSKSELPYSSYSGNGGMSVYYEPSALKDTEFGSVQFLTEALWSNRNQNVVPVWELVQGRVGFRYQPLNDYEAYFSFQNVIGIGNEVQNDWVAAFEYGNLEGWIWDENENYWFYQNLYLNASYFFIAEEFFYVGFYDFGEVFKTDWLGFNSGILPYLSLGGLANNQETRLDGGVGIAFLVWGLNPYYDTHSVYQKYGIEVRQKFAGNTQDTHTVRAYIQFMF